MARRIPRGREIYTIASLLDKQPAGLKKDFRYERLLDSLKGSDRLLSLRFNRRCYTLLDRCIISPENLENFYRTYRLPRHPFFPLFLSVKKAYLNERTRIMEEREKRILSLLEELPGPVQAFLLAFARWESYRRGGGKALIFQRRIYPRTLKRARQYRSWNRRDWIGCFDEFRREVLEDTADARGDDGGQMADRFVLGLPPWPEPLSPKEIKARYRLLSLENHPDRGGGEEAFMMVKEAYERLMKPD